MFGQYTTSRISKLEHQQGYSGLQEMKLSGSHVYEAQCRIGAHLVSELVVTCATSNSVSNHWINPRIVMGVLHAYTAQAAGYGYYGYAFMDNGQHKVHSTTPGDFSN